MRKRILLVGATLGVLQLGAGIARAATVSPIQYVTMDDHVEIAVRIFFPSAYDSTKRYPALLEMEGYGGAGSPDDPTFIDDPAYVVVAASIRGTGCSGGQLDLFSDRSSLDGKEIIDDWLPTQSWWNGKAGIYGHSYSGLTGFLVAAQTPRNLVAAAVSGLIDDFYRGILYPGGVLNYGFPILWGGVVRPESELAGNVSFITSDPHCAENYVQHEGTDAAPTPQLVLDTYGSPFATQDSWAIRQALLTHVAGIQKPIQLGQQYQDEQTGPRGGHVLWQNIPAGVPKRIAISTGRHNPNDPRRTKKDWLDCWILNGGDPNSASQLGHSCADVIDPKRRVLLYFESEGADRLEPYVSSDWPLPETVWQRFELCANGTLSQTPGGDCDGQVTYVSTGTGRHMTGDLGHPVAPPSQLPASPYDLLAPYGFTTGIPDTARYTLTFTQTTAIAGPIDLTLYATITSADVDFWAEILDRDADPQSPTYGATTFVQRGLLRASFDATFDSSKSQKTPGGDVYRPYYGYTTLTPIVPGQARKYEIEVFPLGHVWRAGHELVLQLHAPPANDPLSTYAYEPNEPSVVTILHDAVHTTSILLPLMPALPPIRPTAPGCGTVVGEVCVTPALG